MLKLEGNSKEKSVCGAKVFDLKQMTADWLPPGKGVPTSWKRALEVSGGRSQGMNVPRTERQKHGYFIKYLSSWETSLMHSEGPSGCLEWGAEGREMATEVGTGFWGGKEVAARNGSRE